MDKSEVCTYKSNIQISSFFTEVSFQITECGRRGNQVTSVVVADGVENVAIKDVSNEYERNLSVCTLLCSLTTALVLELGG